MKLISQYGVQNYFYIKSSMYYDYSMYNLMAHKYNLSLCWFESRKKSMFDLLSSTCNQFCKTQTSLQVDSFIWNIFKCILKMWLLNFIKIIKKSLH